MLSPELALGAARPRPGAGRCSRYRVRRYWIWLALPLLAGCGGAFNAQSGGIRVDPGARSVRTGEQLRLSATAADSGDLAPVQWRVTGSDNAPALGSGTISPDGIYTAPGMLSRDLVTVTVTVTDGSTAPVTTTLAVVPGFVEPLQPENATLAPGSSIQVRAQLTEVGRGSVTWTLEGASGDSLALGTLSAQHCESGVQQFTACTVTYTAPSFNSGDTVWLVASAHAPGGGSPVSIRARLVTGEITSNPALHQSEQAAPVVLGGSGGSDNDFDTYKDHAGRRYVADCCGGTLGALVEDPSGTPYILSNNHVLAASDEGRPGDTIEQPGLIDDACVPLSQAGSHLQAVGTLRYAVPLNAPSSNVDAALASVNPGTVDARGAILELGSTTDENTLRSAPPVAGTGELLDAARLDGLSVAKSGRTTGLTCSTVDAVDLRVTVDYYKDCAETQPYTSKTFTGQIGIGGEAFADSGDSGALVLDAANARAIGLLYATGTSGGTGAAAGLTLANPIGDVLHELGAEAGSPLTLRGASSPHSVACLNYDAGPVRPAASTLSPDERTRVAAAVEAAGAVRSARVLAVAAGTSADEPGEGAVLVYVDRAQPSVPVPATVGGVRTVIVSSDLETIARGPAAWPAATIRPGIRLSAGALASARATAERLAPEIMQAPAVFGVGVAQSLDDPDQPALLVLLDSDAAQIETVRLLQKLGGETEGGGLPATLGGVRVRYLTMHRLRVTQSKYVARGAVSSCSVRGAGWRVEGEP